MAVTIVTYTEAWNVAFKLKNLSEKYENIKWTYSIKQIQRQKKRPAVLDSIILLIMYTYVQWINN